MQSAGDSNVVGNVAVVQEAKLRDRKRPPQPHLADSPEWQQLKSRILTALERFPEARQALMEALQDDQT